MTIDNLVDEIDQLPASDKWRLVNHILRSLEQEQLKLESNWKQSLRETYGILADDPIERPSQLLLEEREPLE